MYHKDRTLDHSFRAERDYSWWRHLILRDPVASVCRWLAAVSGIGSWHSRDRKWPRRVLFLCSKKMNPGNAAILNGNISEVLLDPVMRWNKIYVTDATLSTVSRRQSLGAFMTHTQVVAKMCNYHIWSLQHIRHLLLRTLHALLWEALRSRSLTTVMPYYANYRKYGAAASWIVNF